MSAWTYCLQDGKAAPKIVPPRLRIPCWKGLGADSEEKHEPASDINTEGADSLKALDPKRPIREADIPPPNGGRLRGWQSRHRVGAAIEPPDHRSRVNQRSYCGRVVTWHRIKPSDRELL